MLRAVAKWYQGLVASELKKYGLRYQDILIESHPDVATALTRLSPEELSNRNKRIKRALDLSLKHSELTKGVQNSINVWEEYLPLERARQERMERLLNP